MTKCARFGASAISRRHLGGLHSLDKVARSLQGTTHIDANDSRAVRSLSSSVKPTPIDPMASCFF